MGVKRYPLVLMLEPLFRCNLACAGCGKIDYPEDILDRRLSIKEWLGIARIKRTITEVDISSTEPPSIHGLAVIAFDAIWIDEYFAKMFQYINLDLPSIIKKRMAGWYVI